MDEFLPIADQLNILFEMRRNPEGRPYTLYEVSTATGVSLSTISQMRTGRIQNPQLNTVRAMAQFFNVTLQYFETASVEACYALLNAGRPDQPQPMSEVAFRASNLSQKSQKDLLTIIRWIRAAEQQSESGELPPLPSLSGDDDEQP
jgi:transcriptional regulator with XRE-family HTH domain